MITLFSGTPGSGKSYHAAVKIKEKLDRGGSLICNFPVKTAGAKPKKELLFSYWDNSEITPERLVAYAHLHHKIGKEGQTLLIVDEAQVIWNCREFSAKDRRAWVSFFSQHRKLGFDVLLIAQNDRMLDRQIRMLIEYEIKHRKLNNYGDGGWLLSLLTGRSTWFLAIEYWYGGNKLMLGREMIRFKPSIGALYDSYALFSSSGGETSAPDEKVLSSAQGAVRLSPPVRRGLLVPFKSVGGDDMAQPATPPAPQSTQERSEVDDVTAGA